MPNPLYQALRLFTGRQAPADGPRSSSKGAHPTASQRASRPGSVTGPSLMRQSMRATRPITQLTTNHGPPSGHVADTLTNDVLWAPVQRTSRPSHAASVAARAAMETHYSLNRRPKLQDLFDLTGAADKAAADADSSDDDFAPGLTRPAVARPKRDVSRTAVAQENGAGEPLLQQELLLGQVAQQLRMALNTFERTGKPEALMLKTGTLLRLLQQRGTELTAAKRTELLSLLQCLEELGQGCAVITAAEARKHIDRLQGHRI